MKELTNIYISHLILITKSKKIFKRQRALLANLLMQSPEYVDYQKMKNGQTKMDDETNTKTETTENWTSKTKNFNPFYNQHFLQSVFSGEAV